MDGFYHVIVDRIQVVPIVNLVGNSNSGRK
jgi:hypothetical protein